MFSATVSYDNQEQMLSWSATCEYPVVGMLWGDKGQE
jgi:hypothetical protein